MEIGVFSYFSGAGFLDLGFESSDFNVAFVSEVSKDFAYAHEFSRTCLGYEFPYYGYHSGEYGDIQELAHGSHKNFMGQILKQARSKFDLIGFIGGSPCPDFSVGGKNKGCQGENGKLSYSYIELIRQHNPDFFLFENVKGLWKTKRHREFYEELKAKLFDADYILTEKLINAVEYGVPQDRDRIILIGFKKRILKELGLQLGEGNIIPSNVFPWKAHVRYSKDEVFSRSWPTTNRFIVDSALQKPQDIIEDLTINYWFNHNDVVNHSNSEHFFKPRQGIKRFLSVDEGDDSKKSFKRLHRWRYSPTACYGNNEVHLHPYQPRRISVAEALAIQSLPVGYCLPADMSLTKMFKTVGNGVPYLAAKGIADTISDFLTQKQPCRVEYASRQLLLID